MGAKPRQPPGLGSAGKALWSKLIADYEFEPWEVTVVEMAARQADDLALLDAQIHSAGVVTLGSAGQERLAATVTEARLARAALVRLLGSVKLPTETSTGEKSLTGRARHAQKAAEARWANHDRRTNGKHDDGKPA